MKISITVLLEPQQSASVKKRCYLLVCIPHVHDFMCTYTFEYVCACACVHVVFLCIHASMHTCASDYCHLLWYILHEHACIQISLEALMIIET